MRLCLLCRDCASDRVDDARKPHQHALCPEHLLSSVLFLWHYDYSNQFCLNDRRNSIVPINI
jgi:hypothetical protein